MQNKASRLRFLRFLHQLLSLFLLYNQLLYHATYRILSTRQINGSREKKSHDENVKRNVKSMKRIQNTIVHYLYRMACNKKKWPLTSGILYLPPHDKASRRASHTFSSLFSRFRIEWMSSFYPFFLASHTNGSEKMCKRVRLYLYVCVCMQPNM